MAKARVHLALVVWCLAGVVTGSAVLIGGAIARRGHVLVVASGSMAPAIDTGDLIVTMPVAPAKVRAGQVVTFRDPTRHNRLVSHRVRAVTVTGDRTDLVTKGDRNTGVERWSVASHGTIGRV